MESKLIHSKVVVKNSCLVPPREKLESPIAKLIPSALSHMTWFLPYRTRFLFFKNPVDDPPCFDDIVAKLKDSLGKALTGFYPIAGRLLVKEDGGGMELVCNGKGVLFIEAVAGVSLDELAKNEVNGHYVGIPLRMLLDLAQTGDHLLKWPWTLDHPLFITQVTRFACGGICISVKFNHQVLDGTGAWHFVKSWSEISRGESPSLEPVVMETPSTIAILPRDEKLEIELPPDFMLWKNSDVVRNFSAPHGNDPSSTTAMKCFSFAKEEIGSLKRENPGLTTFQLLTAHIWREICRARQLHDRESTALFFAVNCRGKVKALPAGYVGEAAMMARTSTSAGELLSHKGLERGARLVKEKIIQSSDEEEVSFYCKLVGSSRGGEFTVMPRLALDKDVNVGSSFYFPVFQDFGFGRACGVAIFPVIEDGKVYYFPARREGDVIAYVCLEQEVMNKLHL